MTNNKRTSQWFFFFYCMLLLFCLTTDAKAEEPATYAVESETETETAPTTEILKETKPWYHISIKNICVQLIVALIMIVFPGIYIYQRKRS